MRKHNSVGLSVLLHLWAELTHFLKNLGFVIKRDGQKSHIIFSYSAAAQRGPWPPHSRGFYITHNDAPQSVEPIWMSNRLVAKSFT